jgi:Flp pilus assembly pilin Flp
MHTTTNILYRFLYSDAGAGATEYAILVSGIALAVLGGITIFGGAVRGLFAEAVSKFPF